MTYHVTWLFHHPYRRRFVTRDHAQARLSSTRTRNHQGRRTSWVSQESDGWLACCDHPRVCHLHPKSIVITNPNVRWLRML
jgi:hypothetical protein